MFMMPQDTVPEIIDSGSMSITDLFQKKSLGAVHKLSLQVKKIYFL